MRYMAQQSPIPSTFRFARVHILCHQQCRPEPQLTAE